MAYSNNIQPIYSQEIKPCVKKFENQIKTHVFYLTNFKIGFSLLQLHANDSTFACVFFIVLD